MNRLADRADCIGDFLGQADLIGVSLSLGGFPHGSNLDGSLGGCLIRAVSPTAFTLGAQLSVLAKTLAFIKLSLDSL